MDFDTLAQDVLFETIKSLFPLQTESRSIIKQHVWRDRKYVGEMNGSVIVWKGWSANLSHLDFRYRTVFIDRVANVLSIEEKTRLFGWHFAKSSKDMEEFVVMFVLDFPIDAYELILQEGFIPRLMSKVVHACVVVGINEFLSYTAHHWTSQIIRLVILQRLLSRHRKPLDAYEIPLQNLLFRTGYVHTYIVKSGLGLIKLEPPRASGEFGHDLHAIVQHPDINPPFNLGIELYMGAVGYHIQTIPQYIVQYNLKAVIIIAKDDPYNLLQPVFDNLGIESNKIHSLYEISASTKVGVNFLALQQVMIDLDDIRDDIDNLLPRVPKQFGL